MRSALVPPLLLSIMILSLVTGGCANGAPPAVLQQTERYTETFFLPPLDVVGSMTLEEALAERRSQREIGPDEVDPAWIGRLLWAGQGITDDSGHRTAPSAGALYPLELYVVTRSKLMHYLPEGHRVEQRPVGAVLDALGWAAFDQAFVAAAPAVIIVAGVAERAEAKYGARGTDFMHREAGHACQNMLLQATTLDLAAVPVGGFDPSAVADLLLLPPDETVLYLIPIGHPAESGEGASGRATPAWF